MSINFQHTLQFNTTGRGTSNISREVAAVVNESGINNGLCHVFVHHTSASLILCENADYSHIEGNVIDTLDETPLNTGVRDQGDDEEEEEDRRRSMTWAPDGNGLIYLERDPAPDSTEADTAAEAAE